MDSTEITADITGAQYTTLQTNNITRANLPNAGAQPSAWIWVRI